MKRAFTLIELLVVIAIISLLSSIVIGSLNQARAKSRDSKRVQDLVQLRNALELYKSANGYYPLDPIKDTINDYPKRYGLSCWNCNLSSCVSSSLSSHADTNKLSVLSSFLPTRPDDPLTPSIGYFGNASCSPIDYRGYWYKTNQNGTEYKLILLGTFENTANIPSSLVDPVDQEIDSYFLGVPEPAIYSSEASKNWSIYTPSWWDSEWP